MDVQTLGTDERKAIPGVTEHDSVHEGCFEQEATASQSVLSTPVFDFHLRRWSSFFPVFTVTDFRQVQTIFLAFKNAQLNFAVSERFVYRTSNLHSPRKSAEKNFHLQVITLFTATAVFV